MNPTYPPTPPTTPPVPPTPPKRNRTVLWIVLGVVAFALVACCGIGSIFASGFHDLGTTTTSSTSGVTQTVSVPSTPTNTPRPKPTATLAQQYSDLVKSVAEGDKLNVVYAPASKTVTVEDNIGEQLNEDAAVLILKQRTFDIMHALYTKSGTKPDDVIVRILGPATDAYGNNIPDDQYARIELTAATASLFNWNNLTADDAWKVYDDTIAAPYLQGHGV